jgi:hypothetical protein
VWGGILVGDRIHLLAKSCTVDARRAGETRSGGFRRREDPLPKLG